MLIFYDNITFTEANIYNIARNVKSVTFVETAKNSNVIRNCMQKFVLDSDQ